MSCDFSKKIMAFMLYFKLSCFVVSLIEWMKVTQKKLQGLSICLNYLAFCFGKLVYLIAFLNEHLMFVIIGWCFITQSI